MAFLPHGNEKTEVFGQILYGVAFPVVFNCLRVRVDGKNERKLIPVEGPVPPARTENIQTVEVATVFNVLEREHVASFRGILSFLSLKDGKNPASLCALENRQ